jgi:tripartite-type tricarboxylate transporter receptor subunit TctC
LKTIRALAVFGLGLAAFASSVSAQEAYPGKRVDIVVPYTPGSVVDIVAREMSALLTERLGQTVVVENAPGAAGAIGTNKVIRSKADGYTLLFHSETTLVINDAIKPGEPPLHTELAPISTAIHGPMGVYVNPSLPVKDMKELVEYAKANPGKVKYSSSGIGSNTHLAGVMLAEEAGIQLQHIPYQGGAPSVTAAVAGDVEMTVLPYGAVKPQVESGQLKALALASLERDPQLPDLPTADESGVPGYVSDFQLGFFAPPGTPAQVIEKLNAEIGAVVADERFIAAMKKLNYIPRASTPAEFATSIDSEYKKYQKAAASAGIAIKN